MIRRRYGHRLGRPAALARVLRRIAFVRRPAGPIRVDVSPRIRLAFQMRCGRGRTAPVDTVATVRRGRLVGAAGRGEQTPRVLRTIRISDQDPVVCRLVGRTERIEPEPDRPSPSPAAPVPVRQSPWPREPVAAPRPGAPVTVGTVLSGRRDSEIERTPSATPPKLEGWGEPAPAASRQAEPQIDVERLTDQVVRSIDRRLLAYRERRGKV